MHQANSSLLAAFLAKTPNSRRLAQAGGTCFPGGVTHDGRYLEPYSIYVERAKGSRKWDVDGNEYVDYTGGHGALLLGHSHPKIVEAAGKQLPLGTHYGASHELEIRWARLVQQLMPSIERIRFTSSGTEATHLAVRLARAYSGKKKIVRFIGHFHGWHDHMAFGVANHFDGTPTPGVLPEVAKEVLLSPPGDVEAFRQLLDRESDIALVMIEPTGSSWGQVPVASSFLHAIREITAEKNILLLFDEVISGFRCAAGGAQGLYGIKPDLTTLAKILAGGLPGGAVGGRKEILDLLDPVAAQALGKEKVPHQGTFNACPVSAAAGIAALEIVRDTDACAQANEYAAALREALRKVVADAHCNWYVYGTFSGFHIFTNPQGVKLSYADFDAGRVDYRVLKAPVNNSLRMKLRVGMLVHGVEIFSWLGGPTSCTHSQDDLQRTVEAFTQTLKMLKEEGELG